MDRMDESAASLCDVIQRRTRDPETQRDERMKRRKAHSCCRKQEAASAGEDVRRLEPWCPRGGSVNGATMVEKS